MDIPMDFMVSLPLSASDNDAIMVVVDRLTKRSKFIPTKTTTNTEYIAESFMRHYVKDHGLLRPIISD